MKKNATNRRGTNAGRGTTIVYLLLLDFTRFSMDSTFFEYFIYSRIVIFMDVNTEIQMLSNLFTSSTVPLVIYN